MAAYVGIDSNDQAQRSKLNTANAARAKFGSFRSQDNGKMLYTGTHELEKGSEF